MGSLGGCKYTPEIRIIRARTQYLQLYILYGSL